MNVLTSLLTVAIAASIPVMYAALGAVFSERSGISNLGLEGVMLMGAVFGFKAVVSTNSLTMAILATILTGILIGLFYSLMVVTLHANQTVCGLALTIFGTGFSGYLGSSMYGIPAPVSFHKIPIPVLSDIPVLGPVLFHQDIMTYAVLIMVPIATIYIYRTRFGLSLRAVGENPSAVDSAGKSVEGMRYGYTCFGCMMAAMGGAYLTLCYSPSWTDQITAGKGWIAVAIVIFSTWNPLFAALGALLFGGIDVLAMRLQTYGLNIPIFFINMLPYLGTVLTLILTTGNFRKKVASTPGAIGKVYDREDR